jgi:molecular chaperone GrpE
MEQETQTPAVGAEQAQRALEEEQRRNLRLLADFENFRRRATRERAGAHDEGRRAALLPLLRVLDALEQALAAGSTDPGFYEGITAIVLLFNNALAEAGAQPFDSVGQMFDPARHEAVETLVSDTLDPGLVVRQVRRGWRLGDQLLRPAHVVVATSPEPS